MTEQERKIVDLAHGIDNLKSGIIVAYKKMAIERDKNHYDYLYELSKSKMYKEDTPDHQWCLKSGSYSAGREQGYRDAMKMIKGALKAYQDMDELHHLLETLERN